MPRLLDAFSFTLFGPGSDGEPSAEDWAEAAGTIAYEVVTRLGGRIERTYVGERFMSRTAKVATTAGAFVAAGVVASVLNGRQRQQRRLRRGEDVEFGSVHSDPVQVTATDGVLLNCEVDEAERKTPTVVFVHGWVESIDVWHYQRLALRGKVRMVFVDLRSHGESGRSYHDNSSIPHLADDLRTVISTLVPRGPIVLVGHSMGGMAIMELAAAEPPAVRSPGQGRRADQHELRQAHAQQPRPPLSGAAAAGHLTRAGLGSYVQQLLDRPALGARAECPGAPRGLTNEMILKTPTHVLMDFYPNFVTLDLTAGLKVIGKARTVVIGGTADLVTPIKHSRRLAEAIPGGEAGGPRGRRSHGHVRGARQGHEGHRGRPGGDRMTERGVGAPPRALRVGGGNHVAAVMPLPPYRGFFLEVAA